MDKANIKKYVGDAHMDFVKELGLSDKDIDEQELMMRLVRAVVEGALVRYDEGLRQELRDKGIDIQT